MGAGGTRAGTGPPDPLPSLEPGHLYSAVGSTGLSRPGQSPGWLPWAQRPVVFPLTDRTPQTEAAGSGDKVRLASRSSQRPCPCRPGAKPGVDEGAAHREAQSVTKPREPHGAAVRAGACLLPRRGHVSGLASDIWTLPCRRSGRRVGQQTLLAQAQQPRLLLCCPFQSDPELQL
ncbi:unnamed protein product [Rangifer tarandus platyrhynchus]|uniref:Uncharacterized protein n=1 Tax=Rangifer tarandus platyrhynchus TaxID=3082113 RepID=A0ABN8Y9H8_RANTA|nr:unnamed protein product [Rangifer tarandus platyrhynchus]